MSNNKATVDRITSEVFGPRAVYRGYSEPVQTDTSKIWDAMIDAYRQGYLDCKQNGTPMGRSGSRLALSGDKVSVRVADPIRFRHDMQEAGLPVLDGPDGPGVQVDDMTAHDMAMDAAMDNPVNKQDSGRGFRITPKSEPPLHHSSPVRSEDNDEVLAWPGVSEAGFQEEPQDDLSWLDEDNTAPPPKRRGLGDHLGMRGPAPSSNLNAPGWRR